ncbi:MAG TPA: hypothetical protein DDW52_06345 [Planctomycetaceae bacterium]|nr:hypothetical protein [Planctomycetaceae bacterium]
MTVEILDELEGSPWEKPQIADLDTHVIAASQSRILTGNFPKTTGKVPENLAISCVILLWSAKRFFSVKSYFFKQLVQ